MSLHKDLLNQARQLATHEPRRPRQASLRRAVSSAYYALFHLLVDAASREVVSGQGLDTLRQQVGRALGHTDMKKACQAWVRWNPGSPVQPLGRLLPEGPEERVVIVSNAFVDLQQARHEADYDLSRRFSRSDVLALVGLAQEAFQVFDDMPKRCEQKRIFLLSLVFYGRWKR
ncbi:MULTISPECIES: hypothetical protein [unclassified Halomonas]|uniref:hypothetical protein n=1 Tax=unclassified Halomonas TaxID=2609666 RepID=UPI0024688410|nr:MULTISPECIES: hypothetical protein [unclassified Halomonas]